MPDYLAVAARGRLQAVRGDQAPREVIDEGGAQAPLQRGDVLVDEVRSAR
jgi:hypothetical protein